ncbi:hypothetical protein PGT21_012364 [Puccinia graminis f. sp. tritici]|uniref:Uncharacterized protein n=1 Tax=Puccinia graminis f. sp. tritici TaxID=56615 RepID=A0A5B0PKD1_PUCGR|nr:hypothetical protein PGT21_012364 [Puccinia graminis f. sp. tritici]
MSRDQIQVGNATTLAPSQRQQAPHDHLDQPAHTLFILPPISSSDQHPSSGSSAASMATRNRRTSFVDMSWMLPALGISSQTVTQSLMERWRDALRTGSQSIVKTPSPSQTMIIVSEIGDKNFLLAALLAMQHP